MGGKKSGCVCNSHRSAGRERRTERRDRSWSVHAPKGARSSVDEEMLMFNERAQVDISLVVHVGSNIEMTRKA